MLKKSKITNVKKKMNLKAVKLQKFNKIMKFTCTRKHNLRTLRWVLLLRKNKYSRKNFLSRKTLRNRRFKIIFINFFFFKSWYNRKLFLKYPQQRFFFRKLHYFFFLNFKYYFYLYNTLYSYKRSFFRNYDFYYSGFVRDSFFYEFLSTGNHYTEDIIIDRKYAFLFSNISFEKFNNVKLYNFLFNHSKDMCTDFLNICTDYTNNSYDFFFFNNSFFLKKIVVSSYLKSSFILIPSCEKDYYENFDFFEEDEQENELFLCIKANYLNDYYLNEDILFVHHDSEILDFAELFFANHHSLIYKYLMLVLLLDIN